METLDTKDIFHSLGCPVLPTSVLMMAHSTQYPAHENPSPSQVVLWGRSGRSFLCILCGQYLVHGKHSHRIKKQNGGYQGLDGEGNREMLVRVCQSFSYKWGKCSGNIMYDNMAIVNSTMLSGVNLVRW